jgi:hypothetical protein
MTYDEFLEACDHGSLTTDAPELLRSLYEDRRGDWDEAHSIAQKILSQDGSLVHAYLHRKEGDLGNADYWYSRADTAAPGLSLPEEWEHLARKFTR